MRFRISSIYVFFLSILIFTGYRITPAGKWHNEIVDYNSFYKPVGLNIAVGDGITWKNGKIATRYPPGFPLVIAFSYITGWYIHIPFEKVLQIIILLSMSWGSVLIFKTSNLFLDSITSFIASFLWILYPLNLWLINRPLSEPVFIPFLYLAIYFYLRLFFKTKYARKDIYLALFTGALTGVSSLIRPINILLGIIFGLLLIGRWLYLTDRRKNKWIFLVSIVLLSGNLMSVLPWELYVYNKTGKIITLSEGGFYSIRDGITAFSGYKHYRRLLNLPYPIYKVSLQAANLQDSAKLNSFQEIVEFLGGQFRENPSGVLGFVVIKIVRALFGTDSQNPKKELVILLIQVPFFLLSIIGSFLLWKKKKEAVVVLWSIVLYTWCMTVLVLSIVRYMAPVIGLLFIPISYALSYFFRISHSAFWPELPPK